MKMQLFLFTLILLILASCNETTVEPKAPIEEDTTIKYPNCPLYDASKFLGTRCDDIISVSYDGKYSSIEKHFESEFTLLENRWIINNNTGEYLLIGGEQENITFDSTVLSQFKYIGLKHHFEFNPYNSDIVVFTTFTLVDTVGDKKNYIGRDNLFTYNLQTKELKLITPSAFGKGGAIYLKNEGMRVKWLPESTMGNDVFYIRYNTSTNFKYYLQQDKLEEIAIDPYSVISNDLKLGIKVNQNMNYTPESFFINKKDFYLYDTTAYRLMHSSAISFDKKYFVLALTPSNHNYKDGQIDTSHLQRHIELWVVEVDKWLASSGEFKDFRKINPRFQYCMYMTYNRPGRQIAFTPQNTLLVSLHPYNSHKGNVYEMDLKGNILRKITNN